MSDFAAKYPKNEQGHIVFPSDRALRRKIFLEKVFHPSHNNLYLLDELALYLAKPGDVICDPMAGAGSIMYVARHGLSLYLVELGPYFHEMIIKNKEGFINSGFITAIQGDCREELLQIEARMGLLAQAIIFSPPYANELQVRAGHAVYDKEDTKYGAGIGKFTYDDRRNFSNMKEFFFNRAMSEVYQACFKAVKPGGYCCMIIKDRSLKGQRVGFGVHHFKLAIKAGFEPYEWYQREAIGSLFGHFNLARGIKQITDEHIIILKKPE